MGSNNKIGNLLASLKSNPVFAFLSSLVLLAFIMPPRKRKYRPKKRRGYKRRKGYRVSPGNPGSQKKKSKKSKKSKKTPKIRPQKTTSGRRRVSGSQLPAWRVKGSPEAKAHMAKIRAKRKK